MMSWRRWLLLSVMVGLALFVSGWWFATPHPSCLSAKQNPLRGLVWKPETWRGLVRQRIAAGHYTYMQVSGKKGHRWMVVWGQGKPGKAQFKASVYGARRHFYSRRLKRCFSTLHFARIHK